MRSAGLPSAQKEAEGFYAVHRARPFLKGLTEFDEIMDSRVPKLIVRAERPAAPESTRSAAAWLTGL